MHVCLMFSVNHLLVVDLHTYCIMIILMLVVKNSQRCLYTEAKIKKHFKVFPLHLCKYTCVIVFHALVMKTLSING